MPILLSLIGVVGGFLGGYALGRIQERRQPELERQKRHALERDLCLERLAEALEVPRQYAKQALDGHTRGDPTPTSTTWAGMQARLAVVEKGWDTDYAGWLGESPIVQTYVEMARRFRETGDVTTDPTDAGRFFSALDVALLALEDVMRECQRLARN